jgi:hypothetical protein
MTRSENWRLLVGLPWPFLPGTTAKLYAQLGLPGEPGQFAAYAWVGLVAGHAIGGVAARPNANGVPSLSPGLARAPAQGG